MKLVVRDSDEHYLTSLKELLEENGIPAVIQGKETARMTYRFFLFEPTLWIYINEQFDDAVKLIADPSHTVVTGIDVEEFYGAQSNEEETDSATNKALANLALLVIFLALLIFMASKILDAL